MPISSTEEILEDFRQGKMVLIMDDEDRENEGDLIIAAEVVTAAHITLMAREACGLICLTVTEARGRQLNLPLMVDTNKSCTRLTLPSRSNLPRASPQASPPPIEPTQYVQRLLKTRCRKIWSCQGIFSR
jgi:hypothetical protein